MSTTPPGTDRELLGYKLARTNWYQRNLLSYLFKKYQVTITSEQWVILKVIASSPGLSQTEISQRSLKEKTNVTRILDGLEKKQYIVRTRSNEDRRRFSITLTQSGVAVLETVTPAVIQGEASLHKVLTQEEVKTLKRLLDKLCVGIQSIT
ncbi:MAG: MarR family transcriptional regulator [Deltaproteobacteria bacterium]|nr:MarR family transcriptional regulator [Deltaproteobacteria bacterium]